MTTTSKAPVTSTPPTTAVAASTSSSTTTTTATPMYYVANDLAGVKPPSFDWDSSNLAQTFKAFKRYCEIVLATPMYGNRTNKEVVNCILLWMGPKGVEIFDNWKITEEEKGNPTTVWASFSNYFEPKSNYRLVRFQLRDIHQNTNEKIDSFLTRLNGVASKCNFGSANLLDDNLVDQLIKGVASDGVQKKFLDMNPDELILDPAMNIARTAEATSQHINDLAQLGAISIPVHSMRRTGQHQ